MDNLALNITKSITDLIESYEKRFTAQLTKQDELEKKFDDLVAQNIILKEELEAVKKRENETNITTKSDLERMQTKVNECSEWVRLMAALTEEVQNLNKFRDTMEKELDSMHKNQGELSKILGEQQKQINVTATTAAQAIKTARVSANQTNNRNPPPSFNVYNNRIPVRSPSTSSFFSSECPNDHLTQINSHTPNRNYRPTRQSPTSQYLNDMPEENYLGSLDPNSNVDDIYGNVLGDLTVINDLHKSFVSIGSGSLHEHHN